METLNPFVLIRTNSIEKKSVEINNKIEFEEQIKKILELKEQFDKSKEKLINLLERLIEVSKDNKLLNIKRAVYNERFNKFEKILFEVTSKLNEDIVRELTMFYELWMNYLNHETEYEMLYENTYNNARRKMYEEVKNSNEIKNNLLMIQPKIYQTLNKYLALPPEEHKNKERKLDYTLYKVLSRAAMKTSPFSEITRVGRVNLVESDYEDDRSVFKYEKFIKINYAFLNRVIFEFLLNEDNFYKKVTYKIPPLSIEKENQKNYISFVATSDDRKSEKIFETSEIVKKLRMPRRLAEFFKKHSVNSVISVKDLLGVFQGEKISEKQVLDLIKEYVQIGLLVPTVGFSQKNETEFISEILEVGNEYLSPEKYKELSQILQSLSNIKNQLQGSINIHHRNKLYKDTADLLNSYSETRDIYMDPSRLFYEDGVVKDEFHLDYSRLEKNLPVLKSLQRLSLLFDVNIRMQLELGKQLKEHNVKKMNNDFFTLLFDTSKEILPYWSRPVYRYLNATSKWVKFLDELKLEFIKELNEICNGKEDVNIISLIEKYNKKIPEQIYNIADLSSSFFVQLNGDKIIINAIYDGQEKYKARFMDYFKEYLISDENYKKFEEHYYKKQDYSEYTENFGFNGNIKEYTLNNLVTTVGTGRKRFSKAAKDYLEVESLSIDAEKETDAIRFHTGNSGKRVKILFRGSLIPTAMPGYISTLLQLFSSGRMTFKFPDLIRGEKIPRIFANNIILSRRRVTLSCAAEFLNKKEVESSMEYHKRLNLYFTKHGLQKQFFVVAKRDLSDKEFKLIDFKPFFVDILNPISLKVFEKEILKKHAGTKYENLYIEECLSDDATFATEYDIEIFKKEDVQ
ncbi:hypothetical protein ACO11K_000009 [Bacillus cytotoxicus]|uniref:hypothetical protein n=1 Tax=Bacillus cereus group sp. BfR-BA-01492 TaxID=2920361 RepID=UPI001F57D110|nr:hypothetical protein [Bacillus cereus group sp. BfR-BA-01492]EMA6344739.1 hypothetical protein [Bacillus cytotoxicus]